MKTLFDKIVTWCKNCTPIAIVLIILCALNFMTDFSGKILQFWNLYVVKAEEKSKALEKSIESFNCAQKVCTEVLGNINEIDFAINEYKDFKRHPNKYKFVSSAYEKCGSFDNSQLNRQLSNFFVNVNKINEKYTVEDFRVVRDQGLDVKRMLNEQYGCTDYFLFKQETQAASQDTMVIVPPNAYHVTSGVTVEFK